MRLPPSLSFSVLLSFTTITPATRIRGASNNRSSLDIVQASKNIHCIRHIPSHGLVSLQACAGAILRLPIDHTVGIFHTGGADDGFQLPVSRTYNECKIVVEIQGDGTDEDRASWLDLGRDAAAMNEECARGVRHYQRYRGAWMNTGELDRILIELSPALGVGDVEGNGTVADEKL